WGGGGGRSYSC
ncbi:polymorphic outer membrane protein, partial [Chlamydia psittaci 02DC23]